MSFDVVRDPPLFEKMFKDTDVGYEDLRDLLLNSEMNKIKNAKLKEFIINLLDKIDNELEKDGNCRMVVTKEIVYQLRKDLEEL